MREKGIVGLIDGWINDFTHERLERAAAIRDLIKLWENSKPNKSYKKTCDNCKHGVLVKNAERFTDYYYTYSNVRSYDLIRCNWLEVFTKMQVPMDFSCSIAGHNPGADANDCKCYEKQCQINS